MKEETLPYVRDCLEYIIEHESKDYFDYCLDEKLDPDEIKENAKHHIFAAAVMAQTLDIRL